MIIDSSAVFAVLQEEPDGQSFRQALISAPQTRISSATLVEITAVATSRARHLDADADALLFGIGTVTESLTPAQAEIAREVYRRYGRGSGHPARLNLGDCFSYALAKDLDLPLLFKGDDFSHTDVRSAL